MRESEAQALIGWYIASTRMREEFTESQTRVWTEVLAETHYDDALRSLDALMRRGEFITPQRVTELAGEFRIARLAAAAEGRELPAAPDTRPACCQQAEGNGFSHWLEAHATHEERKKARRFGVGKTLAEEDNMREE